MVSINITWRHHCKVFSFMEILAKIPCEVATSCYICTLPLTILTYVTKVERHFNTVHGQWDHFAVLATLQGTMGTFVHSSYQHRLGYIGNPMVMWRLRRLHRALGRGLLDFFICTNNFGY